MSEKGENKCVNCVKSGLGRIPKKLIVVLAVIMMVAAAGYALYNQGILDKVTAGTPVEFQVLEKKEIPKTIETDVIPEYRELERALGCLVDGKVYVIVTRGEKPTAGYGVSIEEMRLEKTEKGNKLVVTALFTEPAADEAVSQVITYPYQVALTELTSLPDSIELITCFE